MTTKHKKKIKPNKWNTTIRDAFLKNYVESGLFNRSADLAGFSPRMVSEHLKDDPEFAALYAQAQIDHRELIYERIMDLGVRGFERPLSAKGELTGDVIVEIDSGVLMALARAKIPEFADKRTVQQTTKVEGHVVHEHQINLEGLSRDKREQMRQFLLSEDIEAPIIDGDIEAPAIDGELIDVTPETREEGTKK